MAKELTKEQIIEVREIVDNSVRVASMGTHYLVAERAYERAYARGLDQNVNQGLIEALERIVNWYGITYSVPVGANDPFTEARAAIKKARGE